MVQDRRNAHILVHDYFEVDGRAVWEAVERDIPELKRQIQALLEVFDEKA